MKIVYIASVRIPNEKASGLAIMRQCEAFAQLGHDVVLLTPFRYNHITDDAFDYYQMERSFNIVVMSSLDLVNRFGRFGFYLTRFSQMITSLAYVLMNANRGEVVYARDPWMLLFLVLWVRKKIKIVWEAHQIQKGFCVNYVARFASYVICISTGLQKYYEGVTKRRDLAVEPSGVYLTQFQHLPSVDEVRHQYGLPTEACVIGYVGKYTTMGEAKGVDDLIQAFCTVHKQHHNTHLLIVGLEEGEVPIVQKKCKEVGFEMSAYTLLPLIQKDFALYTHMADVLVMNYPDTEHYRNYMSPTKLFAYMASGKTMVVSDLPSVREIVDEHMAHFVTPSNIESLTHTLLNVIENIGIRETKHERSIAKVKQFEWRERASRILKFLNSYETRTH